MAEYVPIILIFSELVILILAITLKPRIWEDHIRFWFFSRDGWRIRGLITIFLPGLIVSYIP